MNSAKRLIASLTLIVALAACASDGLITPGPSAWWVGTWKGGTVDGQSFPATFPNDVDNVRYDSVRVTLPGGIGEMRVSRTRFRPLEVGLNCLAAITVTEGTDLQQISTSYRASDAYPCQLETYVTHTIKRVNANTASFMWEGHTFLLQKQ